MICEPDNEELYASLNAVRSSFLQFCRERKVAVLGSIRAGALHHFRDLLHSAEPGLQGRSYKATLPFRGDMVSTYFQYGVGFLGDTYDSDGEHMLELGVLMPCGLLFLACLFFGLSDVFHPRLLLST